MMTTTTGKQKAVRAAAEARAAEAAFGSGNVNDYIQESAA